MLYPPTIKLLLVDLDGTLLNGRAELTAESREAVRQCAADGIAVVPATARPPRSTRRFYEMLRLDTPSIHYNGALVYDFPTETALLHQPIPGQLAEELSERALEFDGTAVVSLEVCDRWYLNRMSDHLATQTEREGFRPDYVGDLGGCFDEPVTKVLMSFPGADVREAEKVFRGAFSGRLEFTKTDESVLQVMNAGVSKGSAAEFIMDRLGIAREESAAIGDAPNDVPMFEAVGLSIAMANGYPEARAAADYVTLSNDENGAAAAVRRFILRASREK